MWIEILLLESNVACYAYSLQVLEKHNIKYKQYEYIYMYSYIIYININIQ